MLRSYCKAAIRKENGMSYKIGSLNLRGGKRATSHQRDFYEFIYNVIVNENLVLFAFQEDAEVRSNSVIDDILGTSGGVTSLSQRGWDKFHLPGPDKSSEFSFVWDSNKIQPTTVFDIFRNDDDVHMFREPLCGDFATEGIISFPYEFRLINIHLWHDGGPDIRKIECGYVKDKIYDNIQSRIPDEVRHVFTVALGDYNLNCEDSNRCLPPRVKTIQDEKTTINDKGLYSKSYDHFSFDVVKNESVVTIATRLDVLQYLPKNCRDMEFYFGNVSDHVPVILEIY